MQKLCFDATIFNYIASQRCSFPWAFVSRFVNYFLDVQNGTQGPALALSNEHVASLGVTALFGSVTGAEHMGETSKQLTYTSSRYATLLVSMGFCVPFCGCFLVVQNGTQGPALALSNEHVASLGAAVVVIARKQGFLPLIRINTLVSMAWTQYMPEFPLK